MQRPRVRVVCFTELTTCSVHPWRLDAKLNEWDEDDRKRVVGMLGGKHMYLVAVRVSKEGIKLGTRNLVAKARYCDMYIPRRELDQHTATDSDHLPIRHYHVNQDWPYQDGRDTKFELVYSIKTSGRIEKNLQLASKFLVLERVQAREMQQLTGGALGSLGMGVAKSFRWHRSIRGERQSARLYQLLGQVATRGEAAAEEPAA